MPATQNSIPRLRFCFRFRIPIETCMVVKASSKTSVEFISSTQIKCRVKIQHTTAQFWTGFAQHSSNRFGRFFGQISVTNQPIYHGHYTNTGTVAEQHNTSLRELDANVSNTRGSPSRDGSAGGFSYSGILSGPRAPPTLQWCSRGLTIVVAAGFGESTKPGKDGKLGKLLG